MKKYCIVLASGMGSRFGADCPKQFVKIAGRMVIEHTLSACDCGVFDEIILVVSNPYVDELEALIQAGGYACRVKVVEGGRSRGESCRKGVEAIDEVDGFVVIHNGVQPFVQRKTFEDCLAALERYPAVTSGAPCVFTVLETNEIGVLQRMPPRNRCFSDLGPECFRLPFLRHLLDVGRSEEGLTNLTGIVLRNGLGDVFVVEGDPANIKITYRKDIPVAEDIFMRRKREVCECS